MKVLVVDDSVVFRSQITACLREIPGVQVVGSAANGRIALQKIEQTSVDLVTLDMEMPELDGLATLREIRSRGLKLRSLVFSSHTTKGAEKALQALALGATDVIAKPAGDAQSFERASESIRERLVPKVVQFMDPWLRSVRPPAAGAAAPMPAAPKSAALATVPRKDLQLFRPHVCVIASSTGGPQALEILLRSLPRKPARPILIAQHMPPVFTEILAKRLGEATGLDVREARAEEVLAPGVVRICPGDWHLRLARNAKGEMLTKLAQDPARNSVRPAADYLFESAADEFPGRCLGVVLTGMGEDGAAGARRIRHRDGAVVIQDRESCVVFGMPGAVFAAGDFDAQGTLPELGAILGARLG